MLNSGAEFSWYLAITGTKAGSASASRQIAWLSVLIALLVALNWSAPTTLTGRERVLGSAIIVASVVPTWLFLIGSDRQIPFLAFYSLVFALYYAVPLFVLRRLTASIVGSGITEPPIFRALVLALCGLLSLFAGYYGPLRLLLSEIIPRFALRWTNLRATKFFGLGAATVGLAIAGSYSLSIVPTEFTQVGVYGRELCTVGILILFVMQLVGLLTMGQTLYLWIFLVPARIIVGLGSGLTSQGLMLPLALCITYATIRRAMPWKLMILGALTFFVLRPVEGVYRVATWGKGQLAGASRVEKFRYFVGLTESALTLGAGDKLVQFGAARMALFPLLAEIVHDTPDTVPYWEGATYYPIIFKPVPRFIFPDKPDEVTGQAFGHRYNLLDPENTDTSINLPQLVELYANFGTVGILLGMFVFGLVYRFVFEMFVHPTMGLGGLVAALFLAYKLIDFGSCTSLVFGELYWDIVFIALVHLAVSLFDLEQVLLMGQQSGETTIP